jgi:hypothetical protein
MEAHVDLREAARTRRPALPAMPAFQASAIATWRGRMRNEHGSARVFEALAAQLAAAGIEGQQECLRFADEERTHGVLCGAVVEALGGEASFEEPALVPVPWHEGVTAREGVVRNVLAVGCLSETVAVALIGAERLAMPEGELRELLSDILADEVGHARFGWRLVTNEAARWDDAARARMDSYLAVAFAHLEEHELAHLAAGSHPPPEAAALGLCDGGDARELFFATVEQVIIPRLAALGLGAAHAWSRRHEARMARHAPSPAVRHDPRSP